MLPTLMTLMSADEPRQRHAKSDAMSYDADELSDATTASAK